MNSEQPFHYLHSKLREWKANDLLVPPLQLSWARFQERATTQMRFSAQIGQRFGRFRTAFRRIPDTVSGISDTRTGKGLYP